MKTFLTIILLISVVFISVPQIAQAADGFALVPCGRSDQAGTADAQCTFQHFLAAIVRLTNYLIGVSTLVAMYHVLLNGWHLITSMGNSEKITAAKQGVGQAVIGLGMIMLAFIFVNLLINGIFGPSGPDPATYRNWWDPECLFDITGDTTENGIACPLDVKQVDGAGG